MGVYNGNCKGDDCSENYMNLGQNMNNSNKLNIIILLLIIIILMNLYCCMK